MKKITLKQLSLKNFKGTKDLTIDFNPTQTFISGANATGKSTVFDAFMWLLFGKDAQDRKDYEIKRLVNGKSIPKTNAEVSGVLDIDGEEIRLRRALVEDWVKPRGQAEEVFKGNHTETFYNDVPLNVGEYQARINAIINDTVFKMVTNPAFFPNMKWEAQREQLFQLAGTITDAEIAASKPEYAALLDKISGKSFADFKREISARKKNLKEQLENIQPRIDQTNRLMPESEDFDTLEIEIKNLQKNIEETDEAIADKTKAIRQQYEAVQAKQSEINALKQQRQQKLFEAKEKAQKEAFEAGSMRRNLENNINSLESEIAGIKRGIELHEAQLKDCNQTLEKANTEIENLRTEWHTENAREYAGNDTCHECGQLLPEAKRTDAHQLFADAKERKLAEITQKGKDKNTIAENTAISIKDVENSISTQKETLQKKEVELSGLKNELRGFAPTETNEITLENVPECVELTAKISEMEATIDNGIETIDTSELQAKKKTLFERVDELKKRFANKELIQKYTDEIANLNQQGKDLAQQIADIEGQEFTLKSFTKAKIEESEKRINGLFSLVTFRLFDYTNDGNEFETCVPMVDGVPYPAVNTAGKVNAGLDIINALTRFHGICAPIFIDGRESVNELTPTNSQIINLVVTHDKHLIIK